jgi:hypothetical protein
LRARGADPVSVGRVIVATWEPHETTALQVIRELGLELQVIFNKGAVMVLPAGVTKASGLLAALDELDLSPHNVVAVGDGENDHALLTTCECAVAVANAVDALKERADLVTLEDHGAGVAELIDQLLEDDLQGLDASLRRHHVLLGIRNGGRETFISPFGPNLLIAGASGGGKSSLAVGLLERLGQAGYQFCVIDPEGDHSTLHGAVVIGTPQQPPSIEEVMQLLDSPRQHVVVNLVGLRIAERPEFLDALLPRLQEFRARTGRPHWILVDEAHHVLPTERKVGEGNLPQRLGQMAFITVEPAAVAARILEQVEVLIAVGDNPAGVVREFCQVRKWVMPQRTGPPLEPGEVLVWSVDQEPFSMRVVPGQSERRRHRRKYAEGDVGDASFYFRGPEGKLKLRAQNLIVFMQIADGLDDETWLHHLHRGEYSRWFRDVIKDESLAAEAAALEHQTEIGAQESRSRIKSAIERDYTLPVGPGSGG